VRICFVRMSYESRRRTMRSIAWYASVEPQLESTAVWGMSWRQEAMKGVEDCEKPGGVVKRALIPGSLTGRTLNP
jgi:hypothetical protein